MWDALSASLLQNAAFLSRNREICEERADSDGGKEEEEGGERRQKRDRSELRSITRRARYRERVETSNLSTDACLHATVATLSHFAFTTCHRIYRAFTTL